MITRRRRVRIPITVEDFEPPLTDADREKIAQVRAFIRAHRWRLLFHPDERLLAQLVMTTEAPF